MRSTWSGGRTPAETREGNSRWGGAGSVGGAGSGSAVRVVGGLTSVPIRRPHAALKKKKKRPKAHSAEMKFRDLLRSTAKA